VLLQVPRRLGNGVSSNGLVVITSEFLLFDLIYQWREQRARSEKKNTSRRGLVDFDICLALTVGSQHFFSLKINKSGSKLNYRT
jgi:hypothetical protein